MQRTRVRMGGWYQVTVVFKIGLRALLYLSLILLCFLLSPDVPVQFIYTEF